MKTNMQLAEEADAYIELLGVILESMNNFSYWFFFTDSGSGDADRITPDPEGD